MTAPDRTARRARAIYLAMGGHHNRRLTAAIEAARNEEREALWPFLRPLAARKRPPKGLPAWVVERYEREKGMA